MGLRGAIAKAVASAFAAVGDIPESVTLTRASTVYDAATGATSTSTTTFASSAIFTSFELKEPDRIVVLGEFKKAIMRQAALATTPVLSDTLTNAAGKVHQIVNIWQDPAAATWTLQVRAIA